jgi:hypothetical protein
MDAAVESQNVSVAGRLPPMRNSPKHFYHTMPLLHHLDSPPPMSRPEHLATLLRTTDVRLPLLLPLLLVLPLFPLLFILPQQTRA